MVMPAECELFSLQAFWQAYENCRRRKRGSRDAQRYDMQLFDNLLATQQQCQQWQYTPSTSYCFVVKKPKAREIHAAAFADRVVHHLLVPQLERLYEPIWIYDLYSNRKEKGTHKAVERLQHFMRSLQAQGGGWFLQLDIANFFNTIHRRRLYALVERQLQRRVDEPVLRQQLLWLTRTLLTGNPAYHAHYRGALAAYAQVPKHKRLSEAGEERGLPIGNLTSQFFANVYLNELDQYIKHQLKCRYYLRFVDDFVLLHPDRQQLLEWQVVIEQFVHQRLGLALKHGATAKPLRDGADFLGYIVRPNYRLVRRRVVGNWREKLQQLEARQPLQFNLAQLESLRSVMASYLGHCRHANSYHLQQRIWQRFPWLRYLLAYDERGAKLYPRWQASKALSLKQQWHFVARQTPRFLVLMQVGNTLQLFNRHARLLANRLHRSLDSETRPPFNATLTLLTRLPEPLEPEHPKLMPIRYLLEQAGIGYRLVVEAGYLRCGLKRRYTRLIHPGIPLTEQLPPVSTPWSL
ncbi:RNA-directed DNA polymerase [Ectothiorhodospiraceae bacterium BW-2]|nr:RNA-directed DNA polymerase [Ectothiorhodospiraceae bacterium BW-2]